MTTRKAFIFSIISLSLAASLVSCSGSKHTRSKRLPGAWQESPITIDGSNKDWPSPYPDYDSKAMLGYAISNDKENLYISVETGDPATMLKILREGLTVWIDRNGKKDMVTGINYPIPVDIGKNSKPADDKSPGSGRWQAGQGGAQKQCLDLIDKVKKMLDQANEFSLQGFKACNGQFPLLEKDSCGVEIKMALDDMNELVWEAKVPFRSFYKPVIDRRDRGKPLSICFETIGSKRPPGQNPGGQRSHGGGGFSPGFGMGGMGMSMRTGGASRGGQTNNDMEPLYKSTTTWKKIGIAVKD